MTEKDGRFVIWATVQENVAKDFDYIKKELGTDKDSQAVAQSIVYYARKLRGE